MTALQPTAPSVVPAGPTAVAAPVVSRPGREMQGVLGPFGAGAQTCFADLFPCQTFDFSLSQEGPIEVTLTWQGNARALFVQLYWQGRWLAHEDVAPREGPSEISFIRPRMEATDLSDPHRHSRTWSGHSFPIARSLLNKPSHEVFIRVGRAFTARHGAA